MSAAAVHAAAAPTRGLRPIRKVHKLVHDRRSLPIPHVNIVVRNISRAYYHKTPGR